MCKKKTTQKPQTEMTNLNATKYFLTHVSHATLKAVFLPEQYIVFDSENENSKTWKQRNKDNQELEEL